MGRQRELVESVVEVEVETLFYYYTTMTWDELRKRSVMYEFARYYMILLLLELK